MPRTKRPNLNQIRESIAKCASKSEFRNKFPTQYREAHRLGILEQETSHLEDRRKKWTKVSLTEEALKFRTRSEFSKESASAYGTALKRGILDEICDHMTRERKARTPSDTIYIMQVRGTDVFKIGVTVLELGLTRIRQLQSKYQVRLDLILYAPVGDSARTLETRLTAIGSNPGPDLQDNMEFRKLTKEELDRVLTMIKNWIVHRTPGFEP